MARDMKTVRITRLPPFRTSIIGGLISAILVLGFVAVFSAMDMVTGMMSGRGGFRAVPAAAYLLIAGGYFLATYFMLIFGCIIYNGLVRWTGGIKVEVEEE